MERTNEALGQYKTTLDDVFEAKKERDWQKYNGGLEKRLSKMDQKVAKRITKDSERLKGERPSLKRKIGNTLAIAMFAASGYMVADNIPVTEYTVQPGDGLSNVAYELNLPNSEVDRIRESYESSFGDINRRDIQPGDTAKRYVTRKIAWE